MMCSNAVAARVNPDVEKALNRGDGGRLVLAALPYNLSQSNALAAATWYGAIACDTTDICSSIVLSPDNVIAESGVEFFYLFFESVQPGFLVL